MVKHRIEDLAIFGGTPAFCDKLHVGCPNIGDRGCLRSRFDDILERKWLTNEGRYVREFEFHVCELLQVKHCVAMCNGTVALEIAARALDLSGEVILPSFTFVATPNSLQWQGITPVFCDIDPMTHNIDSTKVEELITSRTTGIMGVHVWGRPCDVADLTEIVNRRGLKLLFDSAHAFGCSHRGAMIGSFGDAEVFSFHATKFINTFEGGAVVTNSDEVAQKARYMKNFGFVDYDRTDHLGVNGKMNELSAAMGLTNIESMNDFIAINQTNYALYCNELHGMPGITPVRYNEREKSNYQYVVVEVDSAVTDITRDDVVRVLHAEGILARRYFYPGCHRLEPYRSYFPHAGLVLPETEYLCDRVVSLPTGSAISESDIQAVCAILKLIVSDGACVSKRLRRLPI